MPSPNAVANLIADAMVDAINSATLPMPTDARRLHLPRFDRQDVETLKVSVVPAEIKRSLHSRGNEQRDIAIDVGVMKRSAEDDQTDELLFLTDQILDLFAFGSLDDPAVKNTDVDHRVLFDPEKLEKKRVFLSVATLTWSLTVPITAAG